MLVPGRPFQPSLIFVGEAKRLTTLEANTWTVHNSGKLRSCSQTLDLAGKAYGDKYSSLFGPFINYSIGPWTWVKMACSSKQESLQNCSRIYDCEEFYGTNPELFYVLPPSIFEQEWELKKWTFLWDEKCNFLPQKRFFSWKKVLKFFLKKWRDFFYHLYFLEQSSKL